jgi:hypothetical protein
MKNQTLVALDVDPICVIALIDFITQNENVFSQLHNFLHLSMTI